MGVIEMPRTKAEAEEDLQLSLNIGVILVARARINVGSIGNQDFVLSDGSRPQLERGDVVTVRSRHRVWDIRHGAKLDEALRVLYETEVIPGSWQFVKVEK